MADLMSREQWHTFLSTGHHTAKLATVRPDGRPHVVPVWYALDGDDLVFTTDAHSVKARNLARHSRAAVCVDDERPPYSFVLLEGHTRTSDDLGELRHWATRIAERYLDAEQAAEYGARTAVPGGITVRLSVDKAVAVAAVAD